LHSSRISPSIPQNHHNHRE
jgi:hypothetical protein